MCRPCSVYSVLCDWANHTAAGRLSTSAGGTPAGVVSAQFSGLDITNASLRFLLPTTELGHALNLLFLGDRHCVIVNTRARTLHGMNYAVRGEGITRNIFTLLVFSFHVRRQHISYLDLMGHLLLLLLSLLLLLHLLHLFEDQGAADSCAVGPVLSKESVCLGVRFHV